MSGYNELKNAIRRVVKTNNNREITGQNLQSTLTSMVNSLGANYHFAGFASPDTNPGTPDQNIFYIASEEGTYVNFDGIILHSGLSFLMWNGKWSSETISVGEVTKSWVQQNYVSIAFFNELFELYNDSTKIAVNDTIPVDKTKLNIKAMFGFWTEQYISALGKNDNGGSGSGVDMATVWSALAGSTDEQINESHLTTALSEYATMSWVSQIFATITSIPTKLSQLANDTGFITSAALPTKVSQLANDTGFITSAALPTKVSQLANDTGFITSAALPTKVSQLVNDAGYVTASIVNGYATQSWVSQNYALKSDIPTKLSQLANDTGFITSAALPTKVSQLVNDAGYVTASIVNGYATQSWVSQNYVSVEFFERLFQVYSGTTKVDTNSTSAIDNIKAMFGFWTEQYISALGNSDTIGGGGGGLMGTIVPYAKAIALTTQNEGAEIASAWSVKMLYDKIENVDVSGQLTSYLTKQEAQALYQPAGNYLTGITKAQVEGVLTGNITSHTHSQYLTSHQDISGKADRSELSQYLPLSGGTLNGVLTIKPTNISGPQIGLRLHDSGGGGYEGLMIQWTSTSYLDSVCLLGRPDIQSLQFRNSSGNYYTVWHTGNLINVSQLTNDIGYVTSSIVNGYATQSWVSQNFATTTSIPTKLSQLSNDSGYITSSGSCAYASTAGSANNADTVDGLHANSFMVFNDSTHYVNCDFVDVNIAEKAKSTYIEFYQGGWMNFFVGNLYAANGVSVYYNDSPRNVIHEGNIGSQSVNYANSAGSVAWSNVSGRPTRLSDFTDDVVSGKYLSLSTGGSVQGAVHFNSMVTGGDAPHDYVYGIFSCTRPADGAYCCYSFIRSSNCAFGLGYDSSNNIILGAPNNNEGKSWIGKWLTIGRSATMANSFVANNSIQCNGQGSFNSLQIGNITISYDAANKGLRIAGGGLYTDSYLSSLGVDASTALSVKKWADSINLTEESDAELATAYSIGNLYRLINSNHESITQSLNQSVGALQGRCTSLEQRVSALENKVN